MAKIGSTKDILEERGRWLTFEQSQAWLDKLLYFLLGTITGIFFTLLIISSPQ